MEIKQQLRLSQSLVMTPQLQQAIRLLQLSRLELVDEVRKELDNNPVLSDEEPAERIRNSPGEVRTISEHGGGVEVPEYQRPEAKATEKATREVDWEKFLENRTQQQAPSATGRSGFEDLPPIEQNLTKPGNLQEHLLWQLQMSDFAESERRFAELIIGNLDEKGYLDLEGIERPDGTRTPDLTIEDIAAEAELNPEDAPLVLEMIQAFDPFF